MYLPILGTTGSAPGLGPMAPPASCLAPTAGRAGELFSARLAASRAAKSKPAGSHIESLATLSPTVFGLDWNMVGLIDFSFIRPALTALEGQSGRVGRGPLLVRAAAPRVLAVCYWPIFTP